MSKASGKELGAQREYIATGSHERWRKNLIRTIAENMAVYNGMLSDEEFLPQAGALLRSFEAIEGRTPNNYLEIETWSANHLDKGGRLLVVK